jgi:hypothetical protein
MNSPKQIKLTVQTHIRHQTRVMNSCSIVASAPQNDNLLDVANCLLSLGGVTPPHNQDPIKSFPTIEMGGKEEPAQDKVDKKDKSSRIRRGWNPNATFLGLCRTYLWKNGRLCPEAVIGEDFYRSWLESRKMAPKDPIKTFQRALTAHLCAKDGRKPFTKEEEQAILAVVRSKREWPCAPKGRHVGVNGIRAAGYHETRGLSFCGHKRPATLTTFCDQARNNCRPKLTFSPWPHMLPQ